MPEHIRSNHNIIAIIKEEMKEVSLKKRNETKTKNKKQKWMQLNRIESSAMLWDCTGYLDFKRFCSLCVCVCNNMNNLCLSVVSYYPTFTLFAYESLKKCITVITIKLKAWRRATTTTNKMS